MRPSKRITLTSAALATVLAVASVGGQGAAHNPPGQDGESGNRGQDKTVELSAQLTELNFSGVTGTASAVVRNQKIQHIEVHATGLSPDAPHAMHIHFGEQARNECPSMSEATNTRSDFMGGTLPRLSTADGLPAYGPIVVSLTTSGDTSPASGLALDRFPLSSGGMLHYSRSDINVKSVKDVGSAKEIADAIRAGEGAVVIHGVDYNSNNIYDLAGAGASELDPTLPAEGTDPTACGVLR